VTIDTESDLGVSALRNNVLGQVCDFGKNSNLSFFVYKYIY